MSGRSSTGPSRLHGSNPNVTFVRRPEGNESSSGFSGTFRLGGIPGGIPIAPLPRGEAGGKGGEDESGDSTTSTTEPSEKRRRTGGGGGGKGGGGAAGALFDLKSKVESHPKVSVTMKFRNKLFLELTLMLNKHGDPWFQFASEFAFTMGGTITTNDLVKCYPYDFYNADAWDERKWITSYYGYDEDYDDQAIRELEEGASQELIDRAVNDRIAQVLGDLLKAVGELPSVKKEEPFATTGPGGGGDVDPYTTTLLKSLQRSVESSGKIVESDRSLSAADKTEASMHLTNLARKVRRRMARSGHGNHYDFKKEAIAMNLDEILYGWDEESPDTVLRDMGICIFKPEFEAAIRSCTNNLNALCRPKKNFTPYELCMSPETRSQFCTFISLRSTPANCKMSVRTPFKVGNSSYHSFNGGGGGGGGGTTVLVQPANTRYLLAEHTKTLESAYLWFSDVIRAEDRLVYVQGSSSRSSGSRNARFPADEYDGSDGGGYKRHHADAFSRDPIANDRRSNPNSRNNDRELMRYVL